MATIKLYNTRSHKIEEFSPIDSRNKFVSMYTCGPTIYNTPHIGNYRAYIFADILRRMIESNGYNVKHIINLTDVDDKTIKKSIELGITLDELTKPYEQDFYNGRESLELLPANIYPRATNSIPKMIEIIELLIQKDFAYKTEDGSVYFKVSADKNYGILVNVDPNKIKENAGGRMNNDEYDNENIQDFALWKAWDVNDGENKWESPWGLGRPGWHIECSAMAEEFIGGTMDIHTGGIDNMFPHHENEIAQSECAYGHTFANFFVHCNHLMIDGKKMAKSDGNFLMLNDLKDHGIHPLSYKYFLYGTHYRSPANMTWDTLNSAQTTLMRMYEKFISIIDLKNTNINSGTIIAEDNAEDYIEKIKNVLANDLNTAEAIAFFIELFDDIEIPNEIKLITILEIDKILGLGFNKYYKLDKTIPSDIQKIIDERNIARENKDYTKSDELRESLNNKGYIVIDTKEKSIFAIN